MGGRECSNVLAIRKYWYKQEIVRINDFRFLIQLRTEFEFLKDTFITYKMGGLFSLGWFTNC